MNPRSMPDIVATLKGFQGTTWQGLLARFRRHPIESAKAMEVYAAAYVESLHRNRIARMAEPMHTYLTLIASGEMPARLYVAFVGLDPLLEKLIDLMPEFQAIIAQYPEARLSVAVVTPKGLQTIRVRPRDMTQAQLDQVFIAGRIRTLDEQLPYLKVVESRAARLV